MTDMQIQKGAQAGTAEDREAALKTLGIDRASATLAAMLGIEPAAMIRTMKAQCFRGVDPDKVTHEQLAALCSVASALQLNPLLPGMLYAYPDRGGIMPMIGPDGVFKLLSSNPAVRSWVSDVNEYDGNGVPVSATATIFMADGSERRKTVLYSEWFVGSNPNWKARPSHMLEIRALKQCARQVIHGIPWDDDERVIATATMVPSERIAPPALPPASKDAGRKAVAERAKAKTEPQTHQQAPMFSDPPKSPENANSGASGGDATENGELFGDGTEPAKAQSGAPEAPLDGRQAHDDGFPLSANPHIAEGDRAKWDKAWRKADGQ